MTRRVVPTRTGTDVGARQDGHGTPLCRGGVMGGTRYGMGVRYVGATRRVAPTMGNPMRWVTHRVVPTRTGTDVGARQDGHGTPLCRGGVMGGTRYGLWGTVGRGTACRAPTIMGDPSGRPYDGQPDVMGDARDG
ncbi:MAG: hypothetical protein KatS3mg055_0026 [Chloroflexus sp.]|nr:MAG: hypothetical protein KatS3mg055_0026 [Chloroflexus sp.]